MGTALLTNDNMRSIIGILLIALVAASTADENSHKEDIVPEATLLQDNTSAASPIARLQKRYSYLSHMIKHQSAVDYKLKGYFRAQLKMMKSEIKRNSAQANARYHKLIHMIHKKAKRSPGRLCKPDRAPWNKGRTNCKDYGKKYRRSYTLYGGVQKWRCNQLWFKRACPTTCCGVKTGPLSNEKIWKNARKKSYRRRRYSRKKSYRRRRYSRKKSYRRRRWSGASKAFIKKERYTKKWMKVKESKYKSWKRSKKERHWKKANKAKESKHKSWKRSKKERHWKKANKAKESKHKSWKRSKERHWKKQGKAKERHWKKHPA